MGNILKKTIDNVSDFYSDYIYNKHYKPKYIPKEKEYECIIENGFYYRILKK